MENKDSKQTDPLQNLFADIKKILEFIEFKDNSEAMKYETSESKDNAEMWMNAKLENDTYLTYVMYWDITMFQEVLSNVKYRNVSYWISHPFNVPLEFRDNLLKRGREKFLESYEEKNDYYRMLNGLPPYGTPESEFIYLSEPMRNQLHASSDPIHLLSPLIQNSYMSTDEYKKVLEDNPDKKYLRYLGLYKIDIFTARNAKDFDIIRYTLNRSDINPNLINIFAEVYENYREYVMVTLYNPQLEDLYVNYRNFMGAIIMMFTLLQISNKAVEAVNNRNFLDDSILHIILSMYGIPSSLLMTNEIRRNLVINMLKLVKEKGTDEVYYDLITILGYQDIIVSKLLLMKGQQFDKDNNYAATFSNGNKISELSDINDNEINVDPYFIQIDLKDKNPYDTIISGKAPIHEYHKIVDDDPTWWDLPDTQNILRNSNYSMADSKYIMIEAIIYQMKYLFESIYFSRLILDNKNSTDTFYIEIPELFGTEPMSIYDLMVFIVAAMCMNNNLSGKIITNETELIATAGFNFDMDIDSFEEFINSTKYVDKDRIMEFMENLTMKNSSDINRLFNDVIYPMREWLEYKISNASNRYEYVEYESIYRALYTYDINKNSFLADFKMPMEIICEKYDISDDDILAYKHFYPRTISGEAVTIEDYNSSRYLYPFLNRLNEVDWFIHITIETPYGEDDRGYLYFHDILNCDDVRKLTNPDGTRIFMDYEDGDIGWELNQKAVDKAIYLIEHLDEQDLHNAYFQINTPVLNSGGKQFNANEKLPSNIRSGLYKEILKEKILMDTQGLCNPPTTYQEYLYRKNTKLYELLVGGDRFNLNKEEWLNDVLKVVLTIENELNLHLKYFEQSVVGPSLFFKPLITLIKHFKSTFVNFAKTGLSYVFGDKMDTGGNSNMFKIFDEVQFIVHFVTLAHRGYESQFGLYDTWHKSNHHIIMKDRSEILVMRGDGFITNERTENMGSIRMVDEVKFFKNGHPIDPSGSVSSWYTGESGTGRWSEEDDILMRSRNSVERVQNMPVDLDGWKDFVESYSPNE